jgi:glutamine---fructose-6-phosphate transaminase (isomerizing)
LDLNKEHAAGFAAFVALETFTGMCGIIGIVGKEPVAPLLIDALKRLEYRGYDSAGVATLERGMLTRRRAEGKLKNLEGKLTREPLTGTIGIGHTRWATHGRPTENNAHPHATERLAVVHNGIIENFGELRRELEGKGAKFATDTDSEVVAHLVSDELKRGRSPAEAVDAALPRLRGAFALAFLFSGEENLLIGARQGSPLAIGFGENAMYVGSDAIALAPFTDTVSYLEDGDCAVVTRASAEIHDARGKRVHRPVLKSQASALFLDKGNHRHFMAKEIYEQPEVVGHALAHYIDMVAERVELPMALPFDFRALKRIAIAACGTAYYAGLVARYWFERFAHLPVEVDIASEFRYRDVPLDPGALAIFISQSGETADTLASLRYARAHKQHVLSIVNVPTSTIARESEIVMPTLAGPEIGVASTKAFTCQLAALACLAIAAGRARGVLGESDERRLVRALIEVPRHLTQALALEPRIEQLARDLAKCRDVLYLGRGTSYPIALEGALKLKEISYIHAEGYAAGELKHGPIALIDETMPVIVIAPHDRVFDKTVSNMQEVAARGGRLILVTDAEGAAAAAAQCQTTLTLPTMPAEAAPLVYAVPVQLIAYHTAVSLGTDVDQPRNLAKSVTVE